MGGVVGVWLGGLIWGFDVWLGLLFLAVCWAR